MPESLHSKFEKSKLPSKVEAELSVEVDVEGVETEDEAGARTKALTTFTLDFFFFLTCGQVVEDEIRPFSLGALFSVPSCLLFSLWSRHS